MWSYNAYMKNNKIMDMFKKIKSYGYLKKTMITFVKLFQIQILVFSQYNGKFFIKL